MIRAYGWSTDDLALAQSWVGQLGFWALEFEANGMRDAPDLVALCGKHDLAGLVRSPLGTGLLTGTYTAGAGCAGVGLARSPRLVPVPGARSVAQVQANAATQGPLTDEQMPEIEQLLGPDIP